MKTATVFALALTLLAPAASQAALMDWQLNGRGGPVVSGLRLTLYNFTIRQNLKYDERMFGINLGWDKTPNLHNVQIFRRGSLGRPILYTEPVALYVQGGGYVKHEKRTVGINLGWSSKPVYEWNIGGDGGNPGDPVNQGDKLCLFNTVANDFVIYDVRKAGVNLVWSKDKGTKSWSGMISEALKPLAGPLSKMGSWLSSKAIQIHDKLPGS